MAQVDLSERGLRNLLERPEGPLGRFIEQKGGQVDILASHFVTGAGPGPGPQIRTTDLQNSVRQISVRRVAGELQTDVVADARHRGFEYGAAQEQGGYTPQGAFYYYPFLEPALAQAFNQPFRRRH